MPITDEQREYWTNLFLEEFQAEHDGDPDGTREAHRKVLRAQALDQDREHRAEVGRLRQEVHVEFFTGMGYVQLPDSRGTLRFRDPKRLEVGKRHTSKTPRPEIDPTTWRVRAALGVGGVIVTVMVFALVLGC